MTRAGGKPQGTKPSCFSPTGNWRNGGTTPSPGILLSYCGWKKSCTTWDGRKPRPHLLSHRQARPGRRQAAGRQAAGRQAGRVSVARTAVAVTAEDQRQRTRLDELIQLLRLPGKVARLKGWEFGCENVG